MAAIPLFDSSSGDVTTDDTLFNLIATDLEQQGYSIRPNALPYDIAMSLWQHQSGLNEEKFKLAGIGRGDEFSQNTFVRNDEICWIDGDSEAGKLWLNWSSQLQRYLNRRLFLGLFSFESHFAHYAPGHFYKRHYDAFKKEANRTLSLVTYLNSNWLPDEGGELVIYQDDQDVNGIKVVPLFGTVVIFLSEEFPHEVLPATRDRYSIAGWFRVNGNSTNKVDPPS